MDVKIVKIKLEPKAESKQKEWKDGLECAGTKEAKLYLLVDAHSNHSDASIATKDFMYRGYKGETDDSTIPNHFLNENDNWFVITQSNILHIYHDGTISKMDFKDSKKVSYVYHDEEDKKHDLGTFDIVKVDKLNNGTTLKSKKFKAEEAIKTIKYNETGVDAKETRIYANGDIITKGDFRVQFREYKKDTGKVFLVKMKALNYSKASLVIKFVWHETLRHYSNPELFAGFIGALAECSYTDIKCTGSSYEDSSCYPSTSHVNGKSIDTTYLVKKTDEQKFINALWKFGFKLHYIGSNMSYVHGTKDKFHNDHLHSSSHTPNYKK